MKRKNKQKKEFVCVCFGQGTDLGSIALSLSLFLLLSLSFFLFLSPVSTKNHLVEESLLFSSSFSTGRRSRKRLLQRSSSSQLLLQASAFCQRIRVVGGGEGRGHLHCHGRGSQKEWEGWASWKWRRRREKNRRREAQRTGCCPCGREWMEAAGDELQCSTAHGTLFHWHFYRPLPFSIFLSSLLNAFSLLLSNDFFASLLGVRSAEAAAAAVFIKVSEG